MMARVGNFLRHHLHHLPGEKQGMRREREREKVRYAGKRLEVNAEVGGARAENTEKWRSSVAIDFS